MKDIPTMSGPDWEKPQNPVRIARTEKKTLLPMATKGHHVCHILPLHCDFNCRENPFSCKATHRQSNLVNTCWWAGICLLWLTTSCVACVTDATQGLLPPVPSVRTIVVGTRSLLPQIIKLNQLWLKCNKTSTSEALFPAALRVPQVSHCKYSLWIPLPSHENFNVKIQ